MSRTDKEKLIERIQLSEDSTLEFKRIEVAANHVRSPGRDDFANEMAAMANTRGGTVVLGVDDQSHKVLGIPLKDLDTVQEWVTEICNESIEPALDAYIRKLRIENYDGMSVPIIRVDLPRSLFIHKSPSGYFKRTGSSKREMAPDVLARLFHERSHTRLIRFDETIVPGTELSDLQYALAKKFTSDGPSEDRLRKLRIVANDEGTDRLTLAGVLLCTVEPQRWLQHAYIQCASYVGERSDVDYPTDTCDIGGPLDQQVADALHFVRRNMLIRAGKTTARSQSPQFSERAVFEALVNAVAHRDYSIPGATIRLHMFEDRLELYVPGALVNTLTTDSLHLRQSSRNELIVSLLARCPAPNDLGRTLMMDRRGDGVPIVRNESLRLCGRLPEYSLIDESELRLVMWASS